MRIWRFSCSEVLQVGRWKGAGRKTTQSVEAIGERERFERDELEISRFVEYETILGTQKWFEDYGRA